VENRNKSAQRFISDTAASIAPPVHTHIPTTYNKTAWPEGRSARRENGLRNYECFPSSQLPHAKCSRRKEIYLPHAKYSRWKGNPPYVEMLHPGRESATCEMLHPGKGFTSRKFHAKIKK